MKSSTTFFPSGTDPRIYWSDINIPQTEVMAQYQNYISQSKYTEAVNTLMTSDVNYYGAWLVNMFVNRLKAMDDYIPDYVIKPSAGTYDSTEPTNTQANVIVNGEEGAIWID